MAPAPQLLDLRAGLLEPVGAPRGDGHVGPRLGQRLREGHAQS